MNKIFLILSLALFTVPAVRAQENDEQMEQFQRQMHMKNMELNFKRQQAEMEFEQQMRQLELDERKRELEQGERIDQERDRSEKARELFNLLVIICLIVHVLSAIWVYTDIRSRNSGSGFWIVITLLAGLCAVLVYAVIRLGDIKKQQE